MDQVVKSAALSKQVSSLEEQKSGLKSKIDRLDNAFFI
jgi:hypothetical protein